MAPATRATLQQLEATEWFTAVGERVSNPRVTVLATWEEALKHCESPAWRDLQLDMKNALTMKLHQFAREEFQTWNEVVTELKLAIGPLIRRNMSRIRERVSRPEVIESSVSWDILGVCLEAEFSHIVKPAFFAGISYWYIQGHFPCGWDGDGATGSVILF